MADVECDVLIVGAGTGGCAAALAACSLGMRVVLTESLAHVGTDLKPNVLLGGQLTSQMVPPDEHPWIERFGCTARYRAYREGVRSRFLSMANAAAAAEPHINPGGGWVSRLCHLPATGSAVLRRMLREAGAQGSLRVLHAMPEAVFVDSDRVRSVSLVDMFTGQSITVTASQFLDATELGDLLPLAGAEYRVGSEARAEFDEPHATETAEPDNVQGFTWCFAMANDPSRPSDPVRPATYDFWRTYVPPGWPGPLLDLTFPNPVDGSPRRLPVIGMNAEDRSTLFAYRQIRDPRWLKRPDPKRAVTCVNWPQNDYFLGSVIDVPESVAEERLEASRELGRSLLFWLQTECPRPDGGIGYPGLRRVNGIVSQTADGFAQAPYHRESRRMRTRFTVTERMVAAGCNPGRDRAPTMPKSVGVGYYRIDLHPSANGHGYIDIPALPFQIPVGALVAERLRNLLPACKNLGVTHIANGCYRLHPVEWNIGEAAGLLAAFCVSRELEPAAVYASDSRWLDFERLVHDQGFETAWPDVDLTLPG